MIFRNIKKYNTSTVIEYDEGASLSYFNLLLESDKLFSAINHRCLIFSLSKNIPESLIGYVSFINNKAVPLMLDADIDNDLLNNLLNIYKPEYIWLPKNKAAHLSNLEEIYSGEEYTLLKTNNAPCDLHKDLALLLTTSGSTGSPKLVRLSYKNLQSNAESIAEYLEIDENERPITSLPMYYSFGLSVINSHLLKGATILLTDKSIMQKEFWTFAKEQKATSLSGVPYTYEMLNRLRFTRMDFPDLKNLCQAGGKLNNKLIETFATYAKEKEKRFFVMYGQTEATARMSYMPYKETLNKIGSVGIAIPGGEFSLGADGELIYKGDNVSMGYAECTNDLVKTDENNGVLITGDLAKVDDDGYYYIVGRKKRFIKIFGNRVNLDAAEQLLKEITPDVACVGVDDKMTICIVDESKQQDVKSFISKKLSIHSSAFLVKVMGEIPKNNSGKILYAQLQCEI